MKRVLLLSSAILVFGLSGMLPKEQANEKPPNILFINIDDLGFHDLSCYGSNIYETPNLDAFKDESISFTNAYANYPRCTPSRYALMTATYPVTEFNIDLSQTQAANNFIRQFSKAGYQSYYVGKWHLGNGKNLPEGFGFDQSFAAGEAGGTASHFFPFNTQKVISPRGEVQPIPDVAQAGKQGDYLADMLTDEMICFLKDRDRSKPFFAILAPYAVHTPLEAKKEAIESNAQQIAAFDFGEQPEYIPEGNGVTKLRQDNPIYAAMVENMDWNFGRLLKALDMEGLTQETLIVFTSDHGGLSNKGSMPRELATSNHPLRAGKGHLYEGGIRVPLMVKWGDHFRPREDRTSIVALMDLMPTLLDITVGKNLAKVDGKSFKQVLLNREIWADRSLYFYEKMARPNMTGDFPCIAMREGPFKLLHFFEKNIFELYNLESDISETQNLIEKDTAIANRMKIQLDNWKSEYVDSTN